MGVDAARILQLAGADSFSGAGLPRLLGGSGTGSQAARLPEHLARHGPLPALEPPAALIAEADRAGLTGRGGAAFPTARKLALVASGPGRPVVIANGTEGEPASAKDQVLMATAPHLVLDGAVAAARAVGARQVIVAAHISVSEIVRAAAAERQARGADAVRIRVVPAARGFVAGEASAVVNWISTGNPRPTPSPPRLAQRGLQGRPTLVQNVETLAHLALIARYGAQWFRAVGTATEPGSMLVTVTGAVPDPGVREVAVGIVVRDLLGLAGCTGDRVQALLIGGYFGTWVPWMVAAGLEFSAAGLSVAGAAPGAGLIGVLPAGACGLREAARLASYLAAESAGQCGPCVFGLDAIARELTSVAAGRTSDTSRLERWGSLVSGRGACSHPDGAVRMIRSALRTFSAELAAHARGCCSSQAGVPQLLAPGWEAGRE